MILSEISDFKKRELEYELRHEKNNYAVAINGRTWKVFADRRKAENIAKSLRAKGKDASVHETGAPISEGPVIPGNFPNARNDKIAKALSNDQLALVSEKLNVALVAVKQAVESGMGPIDLIDLQDSLVKGIRDIKQFTLPENYMGGMRYVVYVNGVPKIHAGTKDEAEEYAMILDVPGASGKVEIKHEEMPKRKGVGEGNIPQKPKPYDKRNPVAKNIEKFNRPATHMDKKKELKKGTVKHKGKEFEAVDDGQYTISVNINGRAVEFTGSQGLSKVQANDAVDMLISGKRPGNTPPAARYLPKDIMLFRNGQQIPHNHQDRVNEKENNLYNDLMALEAKSKKKTKKDACYHKVKSRYKVWPSAYASGALVQCRKKGAKNWGNSSKKK